MKAIKVIAVLALLVVFPAISYLYLIKGYNFRLEALQELEVKEDIDAFDYAPFVENPFPGRASLVYNGDDAEALAYLEPVFEQFSHRDEFQMISFLSDSSKAADFQMLEQWKAVLGAYPYEQDIALIDTASQIRNYYSFDSSSFTKLIQHIPIIIPRKKEQDIVLKREDEK